MEDSRQLDIDPPWRVLAIVEVGVVVQLERGLHPVVVLELDECKAAALLRLVLLCCDAHCCRRDLLEVLRDGLGVG